MEPTDNAPTALDPIPSETRPLMSSEVRYGEKLKVLGLFWFPRSFFNVLAVGLSFMLLFTAFSPTQNLQKTVNKYSPDPEAGPRALTALYIAFAASNFIAPTVAYLLGERFAMMAGAVGYLLFVASNILDHSTSYFVGLFITAGAINGIGAAILWTAQGSYLTKNSTKETLGLNSGIFFAVFQTSQVIGSLIAAFVLPPKDTPPDQFNATAKTLFIIFASVAGASVLSFLVLRPPPTQVDAVEKPRETIVQRFFGIFGMFKSPAFLLMILSIIYSGLSQAYFAGNFTTLISDPKSVSYVMACFGGTDALASVGIGRLLDKVGRKVVLFGSTVCVLIATAIICLVDASYFEDHIWLPIIVAIICGISDAGYNSLLTYTVGGIWETDPENAFGAFKLIQATTSAINWFLPLTIYYSTLLLDIFLILGTLSFFFLDELYPKVSKTKSVNSDA